jgi:VIT1/CCC1 family predicted Fe2+/Mn2+ transporter
MVMEPPQYDQRTAPPALPAVADRRAPERRAYERSDEDRARLARTVAAAAMGLCGGLFVLFVFFWALGAIDVKDAVAATVVAVLLALVWVTGFVYRRRQEEPPLIRQDRERRGF